MKPSFLLFPLVAALAFANCTSDDSLYNDRDENPDGMTTRYLTVNIVSASSSPGTRATVKGDPDGAEYEDGTGDENNVTKVRFYFFTADGSAAAVKSDDKSYCEYTPKRYGDVSNPNVEILMDTTFVINTEVDKEAPAKIFAVINPDENRLGNTNLSLGDLRDKLDDFAAKANAESPSFVMANSAYLDAGKHEMYATAIEGKNLSLTEDGARENPVVIYVERNVAKVRLKTSVAKELNGYIALRDKDGSNVKIDGKQVYLNITGWNLTATTDNGYLGKHISGSWTDESIFANWNYYPYFRSFWACNPGDDAGTTYISYTGIGSKKLNEACLYTNENAGQSIDAPMQRGYPTQFIIAGVLGCMNNGGFEDLSYAEYAGKKLLTDEAGTKLIEEMVNYVTLYKKETGYGVTTYKKIEPEDVKLVTAIAAGKAAGEQGKNDGERCYVYLALKGTFAKDTWYASNVDDGTKNPALSEDDVKKALQAVGHAKFWKEGKTYYYGKIQHLNKTGGGVGQYGVVRNHIYDITITSIAGLGTPVYDPDETIYPEKPADEDTYIAASVEILSWRVVPSSVELKW